MGALESRTQGRYASRKRPVTARTSEVGVISMSEWDTGTAYGPGYQAAREQAADPAGVHELERLGAKPRRYRIVASEACPGSHQVLMVHSLLGLRGKMRVETLDPVAPGGRWHFAAPAYGIKRANLLEDLRDRMPGGTGLAAQPPFLLDTESPRIVSGRAGDIVRMLCMTYGGGRRPDLWPEAKRVRIDELSARIEERLTRPLMGGGLAAGPETRASERRTVLMSLQFFERMLEDRRFLLGETAGLADLALYAALVRLDPVTRLLWGEPGPALEDFPALLGFVQEIHGRGQVAHTLRAGLLLRHYRQSYGATARGPLRPTARMLESLYSGRQR